MIKNNKSLDLTEQYVRKSSAFNDYNVIKTNLKIVFFYCEIPNLSN